MPGPRETALAAIVTQLQKIRVENGYANDIARVLRQDFKVEQLGEGDVPAAFVLPPLQGGRLEAMDANAYFYRWPITCGVVMKRTPTDSKDDQRETDMESLVNDLWRALLEDPMFGNGPTGTIKDSVLSDGPYLLDVDAGVGLYNCTLQVDLVFQRSDL